MKKVLVIGGPNLNLLGLREPEIYGNRNYASLVEFTENALAECGFESGFYQSNHEGDLVDAIQEAYGVYDGIIINPAAYTHTSVAIPDAIKAVGIPTVEVHLSDINSREEFRKHSFVSPVAVATICGKGFDGYADAAKILEKTI